MVCCFIYFVVEVVEVVDNNIDINIQILVVAVVVFIVVLADDADDYYFVDY